MAGRPTLRHSEFEPAIPGVRERAANPPIDPTTRRRGQIWIHDVYIHNGDDSIAVKPSSPCTRNILVENSYFEYGHGCSIGSVGKGCVENVLFRNITMKRQLNRDDV